jgi:uncharacterized integral membrane protein
MLRKLVTFLILIPLAIVLVMFAMANRQVVTVSFDPFNNVDPAFVMPMPLFALIFALSILGVLVGGVAAWLRQGKWRRNSRRLQADIVALRREIEMLTARLDNPAPRSRKAPEAVRIPYTPPAA